MRKGFVKTEKWIARDITDATGGTCRWTGVAAELVKRKAPCTEFEGAVRFGRLAGGA